MRLSHLAVAFSLIALRLSQLKRFDLPPHLPAALQDTATGNNKEIYNHPSYKSNQTDDANRQERDSAVGSFHSVVLSCGAFIF